MLFGPDLAGTLTVGMQSAPLINTTDQLQSEQHVCLAADFRSAGPAMAVDLWDLDVAQHDPIGRCGFTLGDVVARGVSGIGCGYARLLMSATFLFDLEQIRVVGLPPVEELVAPISLDPSSTSQ